MLSYSEATIEYAKKRGQQARDRPATIVSIAQAETNRHRAVEAAKHIIEQFPQVHFLLLNAYETWGAWEVEIFDLFDESGVSLPERDKDQISKYITYEVIDYSETIMPFEIHSGEMIDLRKLISENH